MRPTRSPLVRLPCAVAGALLLAAAAGATAAEPAAPLTLSAAVARALREAPDARIARLEAEQADDAAAAARSLYWPHASVTSQAGWSNRQNDTIDVYDPNGNEKRYPLSTLGSSEPWLLSSTCCSPLSLVEHSWAFLRRAQDVRPTEKAKLTASCSRHGSGSCTPCQ